MACTLMLSLYKMGQGTQHKKSGWPCTMFGKLGEFWEYQHLGTAKMEKEREPSGPINALWSRQLLQMATAFSITQRLGSEIMISRGGMGRSC